jgi:hypothetical protein
MSEVTLMLGAWKLVMNGTRGANFPSGYFNAFLVSDDIEVRSLAGNFHKLYSPVQKVQRFRCQGFDHF